jgi:ABC-type cobalt transport system substrate-binding protein
MSSLARVLKLASLALCLVVIASFALFVINRTSDASAHQQQVVNGETAPSGVGEPSSPIAADNGGRKGSARRTIDEVAEAVESPFAAITEGSSSEWVIHSVQLAIALVVYGFGLGYVARSIRVRA